MRNKGFTLIELLVAMTVASVLMGLALVSYQGARKSARDGKRKADLEQIRSALEMRRADCGSYPNGNLSSGQDIRGDGSSSSCSSSTVYITIPSDPLSGRVYSYSGTANSYTLCAALEAGGGTVTGCAPCGSGVTCNYKVTNP
jgi:general secretion pathway protein G